MSETTKRDGGPAFPTTAPKYIPPIGGGPGGVTMTSDAVGMTLRDWFAGQAIVAINDIDPDRRARIAENAYALADAMLKAREVSSQ